MIAAGLGKTTSGNDAELDAHMLQQDRHEIRNHDYHQQGDADVAAAIELKIFRDGKGEAEIDRAHPIRISFRTNAAEEFAVCAEPAEDLATKRDGVDKFLVITSANFVSQKADAGFHSHPDL